MSKIYKSGFTLVELAVGLIIIGLLSTLVYTGKDMIIQSHKNAAISELEQYQIAFDHFKGKYEGIPGDISNARSFWGTGTRNGNGNGSIEGPTPTNGEDFLAWQHWGASGYIKTEFSGQKTGTGNTIKIGADTPVAPYEKSFYLLYTASYYGLKPAASLHMGNFELNSGSGGASGLAEQVSRGVVSSLDVFDIDKKIDDENPRSGKVLGLNTTGALNCVLQNGTYSYTDNKTDCVLSYRLENSYTLIAGDSFLCPPGTVFENGHCRITSTATICPEGFNAVGGTCVPIGGCPTGQTLNPITNLCEGTDIQCPVGQTVGSNGQCEISCPSGQTKDANGFCVSPVTDIKCLYGYHLENEVCVRTNCPSDTWLSPFSGLCEPIGPTCPAGQYLANGTVCKPLPTCPPGYRALNWGVCGISCPAGYYADWPSTICLKYFDCPVGFSWSSNNGQCHAICSEGYVYDGAAHACKQTSNASYCPIGTVLRNGSCVIDFACNSGYTYNPGTGNCIKTIKQCSSGYVSDPNGNCVVNTNVSCQTGYTYDPATGFCTTTTHQISCPDGWQLDTHNQCIKNAAGPGGQQ